MLAWQAHRDYPLILAANRDEFFARPTLQAAPWPESAAVIGGRDLEKGGSWLALSASGQLAAVTNFRDGTRTKSGSRSRGLLVSDFVLSDLDARQYIEAVRASRETYDGFNLILAANGELVHYANVSDELAALAPGVYGLSNHLLDTPWPKVRRAKAALQRVLVAPPETLAEALFEALGDTRRAADEELPRTGVSVEWERQLASIFISASGYGTRASTVVLAHRSGHLTFIERSFAPSGMPTETRTLERRLDSTAPHPWTFA